MVDTALVGAGESQSAAQAVRQVTGGCFCCKAHDLGRALRELEETARPDFFIAEPVGSCTDLVATILLPLKSIYEKTRAAAPMSVVVDSRRLYDMLLKKVAKGTRQGFSRDVRYIYLKQLEEAEVIVLNKVDLLKSLEMERLVRDWPGKQILRISARTGQGLDQWFSLLAEGPPSTTERLMEVDYQRYGTGEALLGWFNARLLLTEGNWELDGNALLEQLALNIQKRIESEGIQIAHFKMSLSPRRRSGGPDTELAVVNAVRNGSPAELSRRMVRRVTAGEILINLRAEGAPEKLECIVRDEIRGLPMTWADAASFRPGMPEPVYRVTSAN